MAWQILLIIGGVYPYRHLNCHFPSCAAPSNLIYTRLFIGIELCIYPAIVKVGNLTCSLLDVYRLRY